MFSFTAKSLCPWKAPNHFILELNPLHVQVSFFLFFFLSHTFPPPANIGSWLCSERRAASESGAPSHTHTHAHTHTDRHTGMIERWIRWEAEAKSIVFSLIHYPECKRQMLDNRWRNGRTHAHARTQTRTRTQKGGKNRTHRPHCYRQVKATSVCLDRWQGLWRPVWNTLSTCDTHTHTHTHSCGCKAVGQKLKNKSVSLCSAEIQRTHMTCV